MSSSWVGSEIDEETHRHLIYIATQMGLHPTRLIEKYIREGIARDAEGNLIPEDEKSVELRVYAAAYSVKKRRSMVAALTNLVFAYQEEPTEQLAETITNLAREAQVDLEDLEAKASQMEVPLDLDFDGVVANAVSWFLVSMKSGKEYAARKIEAQALSAGLTEYGIKQAKKKLSIQSVRRSKGWAWVIPDTGEKVLGNE